MRARQSKRPGRVKLTFESGRVEYATLERADDPVVEGHALNPFNLLKDETCTMLGGDPETMVPDDAMQMLAALACSGGSGSGDVGDLEDTAFEVGQFTNAAAGWCTFNFREPFDEIPKVILQPVNFSGWAEIRNISKTGFQYCLRQPYFTAGSAGTPGSVTTGQYYTARGSASSYAHDETTLVSAVELPTQPTLPTATNRTTASKIVIQYFAIDYGGER